MKRQLIFILLISFSSCCKQRIISASIAFKFEGFDPSMRQVIAISSQEHVTPDTLVMVLDDNKKGIFHIRYFYSDSIYLTGLIPAGDISLKSVKTVIKNIGSGCGGPADEAQVSFSYKDSTYIMAGYHFVVIKR